MSKFIYIFSLKKNMRQHLIGILYRFNKIEQFKEVK